MATAAKPAPRRRSPADPPPVAVSLAPRTIVLFVAVALGALLLLAAAYAVRDLLVQLVVAIVLALAAEPVVQAFERRGLGRGAAVGVSFGLLALALDTFPLCSARRWPTRRPATSTTRRRCSTS